MDIDILRMVVRKKHKKLSTSEQQYGKDTLSSFNYSMYTKIKKTSSHIDPHMELQKKQEQTVERTKESAEENVKLANYFNMGYYVITPIFLGVFLGLFLDNIFKTKPFFILLLLVLGTIASFYNIFKTLKE